MVRSSAVFILLSTSSLLSLASGPADRVPTDPKSVVSAVQAKAAPVKVADLLQTTHIADATLSPDGRRIAYVGDASGRLNLWLMNVDGTEARQLLHANDRQADLTFTRDGREIVYIQDKGGDLLESL